MTSPYYITSHLTQLVPDLGRWTCSCLLALSLLLFSITSASSSSSILSTLLPSFHVTPAHVLELPVLSFPGIAPCSRCAADWPAKSIGQYLKVWKIKEESFKFLFDWDQLKLIKQQAENKFEKISWKCLHWLDLKYLPMTAGGEGDNFLSICSMMSHNSSTQDVHQWLVLITMFMYELSPV